MTKEAKFNIITEGLTAGVSITCKKYNISRTLYYRWLKRYQSNGIDGLNDIKKNFTPINKTDIKIEATIIKLIKTYPKYGPRGIKYLLEEFNFNISESAVFNVMKRHKLTNKESRIKFARKTVNPITDILPPLYTLKSGECWIFWITDIGKFQNFGHIYVYTFYDLVSRVSCSRLYQGISYDNFEDLLTAVAIPVAQSLNLKTNYLCFFKESKLISQTKNLFNSKIDKTFHNNRLTLHIHILRANEDLDTIHRLKKNYTEECISFLMTYLLHPTSFNELKLNFQTHIRDYNFNSRLNYENINCSPIEYHSKKTETKLILPIWAYIDREY